jgi:hypothetical protein
MLPVLVVKHASRRRWHAALHAHICLDALAGSTAQAAMRLIAHKKPALFLIENVKNSYGICLSSPFRRVPLLP